MKKPKPLDPVLARGIALNFIHTRPDVSACVGNRVKIRGRLQLLHSWIDAAWSEFTATERLRAEDWRERYPLTMSDDELLALASAIMEWGRLRGHVPANTARIKRVKTQPLTRLVRIGEIDAVLTVARQIGPAATLQALCAKAALLCLRRPSEIQQMTRAQVGKNGIAFEAAKRKGGEATKSNLIRWSPILKATIDEAMAVPRRGVDICPYVFGTEDGDIYTKSGWGTGWGRLMKRCEKDNPGFQRFTLRDCRPGGVTVKKERRDDDVLDATMHADGRMVDQIYDRRRGREADPAH